MDGGQRLCSRRSRLGTLSGHEPRRAQAGGIEDRDLDPLPEKAGLAAGGLFQSNGGRQALTQTPQMNWPTMPERLNSLSFSKQARWSKSSGSGRIAAAGQMARQWKQPPQSLSRA